MHDFTILLTLSIDISSSLQYSNGVFWEEHTPLAPGPLTLKGCIE